MFYILTISLLLASMSPLLGTSHQPDPAQFEYKIIENALNQIDQLPSDTQKATRLTTIISVWDPETQRALAPLIFRKSLSISFENRPDLRNAKTKNGQCNVLELAGLRLASSKIQATGAQGPHLPPKTYNKPSIADLSAGILEKLAPYFNLQDRILWPRLHLLLAVLVMASIAILINQPTQLNLRPKTFKATLNA